MVTSKNPSKERGQTCTVTGHTVQMASAGRHPFHGFFFSSSFSSFYTLPWYTLFITALFPSISNTFSNSAYNTTLMRWQIGAPNRKTTRKSPYWRGLNKSSIGGHVVKSEQRATTCTFPHFGGYHTALRFSSGFTGLRETKVPFQGLSGYQFSSIPASRRDTLHLILILN